MENMLLSVDTRFLFYKLQGFRFCTEVNLPWELIPKENRMLLFFKSLPKDL